jgi:hypothetical protein
LATDARERGHTSAFCGNPDSENKIQMKAWKPSRLFTHSGRGTAINLANAAPARRDRIHPVSSFYMNWRKSAGFDASAARIPSSLWNFPPIGLLP